MAKRTSVKEVYEDAREALRMCPTMEFEEWAPAWMVNDETGELLKDKDLEYDLRVIWERAKLGGKSMDEILEDE